MLVRLLKWERPPLDSLPPPSYNPAQQNTKNADEDEYVSKRFSESLVKDGVNRAKAQRPNGPPSCEEKAPWASTRDGNCTRYPAEALSD